MKLTDTQRIILTAASQRPSRCVLPLPDRIKGGAAQKLVGALIARGLVREVEAGPDAPSWRAGANGPVTTLVATDAAFAALGIEAGSTPTGGNAALRRCGGGQGPWRRKGRRRRTQRPGNTRNWVGTATA